MKIYWKRTLIPTILNDGGNYSTTFLIQRKLESRQNVLLWCKMFHKKIDLCVFGYPSIASLLVSLLVSYGCYLPATALNHSKVDYFLMKQSVQTGDARPISSDPTGAIRLNCWAWFWYMKSWKPTICGLRIQRSKLKTEGLDCKLGSSLQSRTAKQEDWGDCTHVTLSTVTFKFMFKVSILLWRIFASLQFFLNTEILWNFGVYEVFFQCCMVLSVYEDPPVPVPIPHMNWTANPVLGPVLQK